MRPLGDRFDIRLHRWSHDAKDPSLTSCVEWIQSLPVRLCVGPGFRAVEEYCQHACGIYTTTSSKIERLSKSVCIMCCSTVITSSCQSATISVTVEHSLLVTMMIYACSWSSYHSSIIILYYQFIAHLPAPSTLLTASFYFFKYFGTFV